MRKSDLRDRKESAARYDWLREHVWRVFGLRYSPEAFDALIDRAQDEWLREGPAMYRGKPVEPSPEGWSGGDKG
jgi:hypothetical protein